jgi:hypothetical protein
VTWFATTPRFLQLVLYIADRDSLVSLVRCCAGANTAPSVERADNYASIVPAPGEDDLRYVLYVKDEEVSVMGIYLVKELAKKRRISTRRVRAWRKLWDDLYGEQFG